MKKRVVYVLLAVYVILAICLGAIVYRQYMLYRLYAQEKADSWRRYLPEGHSFVVQTETGIAMNMGVTNNTVILLCYNGERMIASLKMSTNAIGMYIDSYPEMTSSLFHAQHMEDGTLFTIYDDELLPTIRRMYNTNGQHIYSMERREEDIFQDKDWVFVESDNHKDIEKTAGDAVQGKKAGEYTTGLLSPIPIPSCPEFK